MPRKKIELNNDVEKLVEKYMGLTGESLDSIVNKALKNYTINNMSPNEVKDALKKADMEAGRYIDHMFKDSINNDAYGNF